MSEKKRRRRLWIVVGGLVVLVTLMGSVRERQREIGIFRAIGFRRSHVMRIIFLEAGIVSLMAGIFGYALGIAGAAIGVRLIGGAQAGRVVLDPNLAAGAVIGSILAARVEMTAMPQLVAALHSFVGMAAVLVAIGTFINRQSTGQLNPVLMGELSVGIIIGAITFSGSVIAFGKLFATGRLHALDQFFGHGPGIETLGAEIGQIVDVILGSGARSGRQRHGIELREIIDLFVDRRKGAIGRGRRRLARDGRGRDRSGPTRTTEGAGANGRRRGA